MSYEPLIDQETGELRVAFEAEDGFAYLAAPTGEVIAYLDEDAGGWVELEPGTRVEDLQFDAVVRDARLAVVETQVYGADDDEEDYDAYGYGYEGEEDREEQDADGYFSEQIARQLQLAERERRADFTRAEQEKIARLAAERYKAGEDASVNAVLEKLAESGDDLRTRLDSRQGRQDWQVERIEDGERDEREQLLGEPDPPSRGESDGDDRTQRQDWMSDALQGKAVGPIT